jgi:hypothetical protein
MKIVNDTLDVIQRLLDWDKEIGAEYLFNEKIKISKCYTLLELLLSHFDP